MKSTVIIFGIHLPGQKIVPTTSRADALQKVDVPSPLERYLGRPRDSSFHDLTDLDDHSRCCVDDHSIFSDVHRDVCEPFRLANPKKEPVLCIVNAVHAGSHDVFALRLPLRGFAAGTWERLQTWSGELCHRSYEVAQQHEPVSNQSQEAAD
jgi:hypothetical protein